MLKNLLFISIVPTITIISQFFLKKGIRLVGEIKISGINDFFSVLGKIISNQFILIGIAIAAVGLFFWLVVISKLDLSTAFPIAGGVFYILIFLMSWLLLGEAITFGKIAGTALILAGIGLISAL